MLSKKFLPLLRELSDTFQAFEIYSASHIRAIGLTPPQFDIIATLGNTQGMSPKELGEKTLITKGTLTGVMDRRPPTWRRWVAPTSTAAPGTTSCATTRSRPPSSASRRHLTSASRSSPKRCPAAASSSTSGRSVTRTTSSPRSTTS